MSKGPPTDEHENLYEVAYLLSENVKFDLGMVIKATKTFLLNSTPIPFFTSVFFFCHGCLYGEAPALLLQRNFDGIQNQIAATYKIN